MEDELSIMGTRKLPNLISDDPAEWAKVLRRVLELAKQDHEDGKREYRTGTGLRLEVGEMRVDHRRMLTTVYRTFRHELVLQAEARKSKG